jgi:hypothetical protein
MRASFAHPESTIDQSVVGLLTTLATWSSIVERSSSLIENALPVPALMPTSLSRPTGRLKEITNAIVPQEDRAGCPPGSGRGTRTKAGAGANLRL